MALGDWDICKGVVFEFCTEGAEEEEEKGFDSCCCVAGVLLLILTTGAGEIVKEVKPLKFIRLWAVGELAGDVTGEE